MKSHGYTYPTKLKKTNYDLPDSRFTKYYESKKILIPLIFLLCASLIVNVCLIWGSSFKSFLKLFVNKDGDFEWLALTAIVAMISFIINSWLTAKKNRSDLVSQSRIEWIQNQKSLLSKYLSMASYFPHYRNQLIKKNDVDIEEMNVLLQEIREIRNLLLLNLSENDDNTQFRQCIEQTSNWINTMVRQKKPFEYNQIPVQNLQRVSTAYLKREWEKAKKGK